MYINNNKSERLKKRPTKKVNNQQETNVVSGRIGWAQPKIYVCQNSAPTQRIFDLTDAFFFPTACRTRYGGRKYPNRLKTALFTPMSFYVEVFPPLEETTNQKGKQPPSAGHQCMAPAWSVGAASK